MYLCESKVRKIIKTICSKANTGAGAGSAILWKVCHAPGMSSFYADVVVCLCTQINVWLARRRAVWRWFLLPLTPDPSCSRMGWNKRPGAESWSQSPLQIDLSVDKSHLIARQFNLQWLLFMCCQVLKNSVSSIILTTLIPGWSVYDWSPTGDLIYYILYEHFIFS